MAKPQLENGHTRIANEILEHLVKIHLSPNQWQVLLCIIRKTYGYNKKVDHIANSQIVQATGLCKAVISRALHDLNDMNIITRNGKHIGVQKDWELWPKFAEQSTLDIKFAEQSTSKVSNNANQSKQYSQPELAKQSTKVSSCAVTQKKKETIQKKLYKRKYGEFQNVLLTDGEYQKLQDRFGAKVPDMIEALSEGIESKGYKYQRHYATLLSWERRELKAKGGQSGTYRQSPRQLRPRDSYTKPEEG